MTRALTVVRPESVLLMVVDLQERLLPAIHDHDSVVEASRRMIEAARLMQLPILLTEQYPEGLGATAGPIRGALGDVSAATKTRFSACVEPVVNALRDLGRPHVIVVGIEAHVCVQQSALDLLRLGYTTYVCADAVGSRRTLDRDTALERMRQAGALITTTESITFELLGEAGTDLFKRVLKIVK